MLKKTISYSFKEFFDDNVKFKIEKDHRKKYIRKICVGAYALCVTAITIYSNRYIAIEIPVQLLASVSPAGSLSKSFLTSFNELVVEVLNKMYAASCIGGLVVESVQCNNNTEKKFGACITKYAIAYTGGLFVLYVLSEIQKIPN